MRKRTKAREFAMQVLYQSDITREPLDVLLEHFWQDLDEELAADVDDALKSFAEAIVKGVEQNLAAIDSKISQYADNWQLERMAVVDRNILRMSCYELTFRSDIPPKVSINEAVELAKKYSGVEAGKFVNAILDKIKKELSK
jgi:transcription antitermination factor NusB